VYTFSKCHFDAHTMLVSEQWSVSCIYDSGVGSVCRIMLLLLRCCCCCFCCCCHCYPTEGLHKLQTVAPKKTLENMPEISQFGFVRGAAAKLVLLSCYSSNLNITPELASFVEAVNSCLSERTSKHPTPLQYVLAVKRATLQRQQQ
jgi:hypothetical protein